MGSLQGAINNASFPSPGFRSGRYYPLMGESQSTVNSTNGTAPNTLTYSGFWIPEAVAIDRICINVQTGASGTLARYGIYRNLEKLPGNLLVDCGEVDCSTLGSKEALVNISLNPGYYWMAINSFGSLAGLTCKNSATFRNMGVYGFSSISTVSTMAGFRSGTVPFGGALPAVAPISALNQHSGSEVLFWVRVAA